MSVKTLSERQASALRSRKVTTLLAKMGACYGGRVDVAAKGSNAQTIWNTATFSNLYWYLRRLGGGYSALAGIADSYRSVYSANLQHQKVGFSDASGMSQTAAAELVRTYLPNPPIKASIFAALTRKPAVAAKRKTAAKRKRNARS